MDELQNKVLQMAYQKYLDGKRAEIPFHKICSSLTDAHETIDALETDGMIQVNFKAIGYVDFALSDFGLSYCEDNFS